MSIGINTNQPSDLSSLNSGSDINTSNQPSDDDADAFAAMVGQNSSDSAEVIVQRDSSEPTLLTPDFEQSEVGLGSPFDHVGNFSGRINRGVGPILVDAGFKFKPHSESFYQISGVINGEGVRFPFVGVRNEIGIRRVC